MSESACYILMLVMAGLIIFGFRSTIRDTRGSRALFSINGVMVTMFLLYVWVSAALSVLFDNFEFTWAPHYSGAENALPILLICLFALASYMAGYSFFGRIALSRLRSLKQFEESLWGPPEPKMLVRVAALSMIVIGILLKLYAILQTGGLDESVIRLSGGLRENLNIGQEDVTLTWVRNFSGIAEVAASWMLVIAIRRRRGLVLWGALFIVTVALVYLGNFGKRTYLLEPLFAVVLAFHFYVRRLQLSSMPYVLVGVIVFGMGSQLLRAVLPAYMNNIDISYIDASWSHGSWLGFYFYSLEFAFFEAMTVTIYESDQIIEMFGSTANAFYITNIEPMLYLIPRYFWPDKPTAFIDMGHATTTLMFGGSPSTVEWGTAASYIGNSWALGGPIGTALYSFMLAFIAAYSDVFMMRATGENKDAKILVYSVLLFAAFILWRQGGLGWSFMSLVPNQIGYILGFGSLLYLTIGRSRRSREPAARRRAHWDTVSRGP
ncbi:hypothetical protein [uncultured Bradyrhizobium sp.]|jgi:hypothetical protein|uniref:hypothetical protein n=1 Tax=uncultured Bradyrhizobium sp. TaxID=199684 RepID=UPI00263A249B|nr:hypothetical protein [uncultured Bradyrhizobium sp.]